MQQRNDKCSLKQNKVKKKPNPNTTTYPGALMSFSLLQEVWRALRFSLQSLSVWPWSHHISAHAPACRWWSAVLWICLVQLSWSTMVTWDPTVLAPRCGWSQRSRMWNICKVLTECFEPSGAGEVPGVFFANGLCTYLKSFEKRSHHNQVQRTD